MAGSRYSKATINMIKHYISLSPEGENKLLNDMSIFLENVARVVNDDVQNDEGDSSFPVGIAFVFLVIFDRWLQARTARVELSSQIDKILYAFMAAVIIAVKVVQDEDEYVYHLTDFVEDDSLPIIKKEEMNFLKTINYNVILPEATSLLLELEKYGNSEYIPDMLKEIYDEEYLNSQEYFQQFSKSSFEKSGDFTYQVYKKELDEFLSLVKEKNLSADEESEVIFNYIAIKVSEVRSIIQLNIFLDVINNKGFKNILYNEILECFKYKLDELVKYNPQLRNIYQKEIEDFFNLRIENSLDMIKDGISLAELKKNFHKLILDTVCKANSIEELSVMLKVLKQEKFDFLREEQGLIFGLFFKQGMTATWSTIVGCIQERVLEITQLAPEVVASNQLLQEMAKALLQEKSARIFNSDEKLIQFQQMMANIRPRREV